jgi:hypothetical protein
MPDLDFLGDAPPGTKPTEIRYPRCFVTLNVNVVTRDARVETPAAVDEPFGTTTRTLTVPQRTDTVHTGIIPSRCSWTRRTFKQAGECEITFMGSSLPFNPLTVQGVFARVFMGNVSRVNIESAKTDSEIQQPHRERFCGYVDQYEEHRGEDGPEITFKLRDLSALFRDRMPLTADFAPLYSDTLREAVQRIIDFVCKPFVDAGEQAPINLQELPDPFDPLLSSAAHHRGATGPVQLVPNATCWAVIEHICGLVSATPYMFLDELRITEVQQSYGAESDSAYSFVFGQEDANVLKLERTRKFARNRKGVRMVSYDPEARQVIEGQWPPKGQEPGHTTPARSLGNRTPPHRRASSSGHSTRTRTVTPPKDFYELLAAPNGISDPDMLTQAAKAAYLERSLGDLEGRLETHEFDDDILNLNHSDRIDIGVQPSLEAELISTTSDRRAIRLLADRLGMDEQTLSVLIASTRQFPLAQYFVRSVTAEFQAEDSSHVTIEFLKLTDATGSGL